MRLEISYMNAGGFWSFVNWITKLLFQSSEGEAEVTKAAIRNNDSDIEDIEFVKDFKNERTEVFDSLVVKYKDLVFNICYRFIGEYEEANDCAQDVFVKVFQALGEFKGDAKFSTWLYAIALNVCRNRVGSLAYRIKKRFFWLDAPKETEDGQCAQELKGNDLNPHEEVEKNEQERAVQSAINSLDSKQREIVLLRDIEGLAYEEIARITGNNLGTVKSRLARARSGLKRKLEEMK